MSEIQQNNEIKIEDKLNDEEWINKMSEKLEEDDLLLEPISSSTANCSTKKAKRRYPCSYEEISDDTKNSMAKLFFDRLLKRRQKSRENKKPKQIN
jgi:hypothetical protein